MYTDPVGRVAPTCSCDAASAPVRSVLAKLRLLEALARALPENRTVCLAAAGFTGTSSSSRNSAAADEPGLAPCGVLVVVTGVLSSRARDAAYCKTVLVGCVA